MKRCHFMFSYSYNYKVCFYICLFLYLGFVYEYESICVPISTCNQRTSSFLINGIAISWSMASTHPYNIAYDHATGTYHFCFSNVTENILFTEFCHGSPDSTDCPLCSMSSGIFKFVSHADISIQGRPSFSINKC